MRVEICVLRRTRRRSIGALSRREAASCPRVRPVSSTSGTARPRCSIRPASCGRAQRPRRPRQVAASRGGPAGSGQSAAVRHQQQHEASPQHPAQWNVVHAVGSYGDCRHRHGRSARSPGRPDRREEAKRSLLRHRPAQGSCEPDALSRGMQAARAMTMAPAGCRDERPRGWRRPAEDRS